MNDRRKNDEILLIDFLLGRCDTAVAEQLRERLKQEPQLKRLHDDIANTFSAVALTPQVDHPQDLGDKTLQRIRQYRQTQQLLARQQLGRPAVRSTFSLRELAGVAAAIFLVTAILIPSVRHARRLAIQKNCASNIGQIGAALGTYASENRGRLPSTGDVRTRWLSTGGQPVASNSAALFRLIRQGHASPLIFQCPATGKGTFILRAEMCDFPGPKYISYSFQYAIGPNTLSLNDPALADVTGQMVILADRTPVFYSGRFHKDRINAQTSDNHGERGQNVLYIDMHVEWKKAPNVGVAGDNIFLADGIFDYRGDETPKRATDTFLLPAHSSSD